jgi:hypothetical protein
LGQGFDEEGHPGLLPSPLGKETVMTRFCERPAIERVFLLLDIYDKAEELVEQANHFQVDEIIDGIEGWMKSEGVVYGSFVDSLRAKAKKKQQKATEDTRRVFALLEGLK